MPDDPRVIEPIMMERMMYVFEKVYGKNYISGGIEESDEDFEKNLLDYAPKNNVERAQLMVYEAYAVDDNDAKRKIAMEAIDVDPFCCDAYTLLGFAEVDDGLKALGYFKMGESLFRQRHTEEYFKKNEGEFMNCSETRPYMRNLYYTILLEETLGLYEDAMKTGNLMLKLNKEDSMRIESRMVMLYAAKDKMTELKDFLNKIPVERLNEHEINFGMSYCYFHYHNVPEVAFKYAELLFRSNSYINKFFMGKYMPKREKIGEIPSDEEESAKEFISMFSRVFSENPVKVSAWISSVREFLAIAEKHKAKESKQKEKIKKQMVKQSKKKNRKK